MAKSAKTAQQEYNNVLGISYMLINALAISIIYAFIKELTEDVGSSLVVFLYKFIILFCIIPWCFAKGFKDMKTKKIWLHASRGFLSVSASLSLFYAIKHIDLIDMTAVGYLEQVLWAIIGIALFGERSSKTKIVAIIASFLGAIIVVYPDILAVDDNYIPKFLNATSYIHFNKFYIFVFISIILWAANCTVVKILGKTEKTKVQLFYGLIFQLLLAAPFAFLNWQETHLFGILVKEPVGWIDFSTTGLKLSHISILVLLAICYFTHSTSFFLSLKNAELSTVVPFDYTRLIFTGILGYVFFNEVPEKGSYIGYCLITGAGVCLMRAEARYRKRMKASKIQQLEEEFEHA